MDIKSDTMAPQNYPKTTLVKVRGKWNVQATIPKELRPAFSDRVQLRRSTGTEDRREAERRLHSYSSKIYAEFDEAAQGFDPVAHAANELSKEMRSGLVWTPEDWSPEQLPQSERELQAQAYSVLHLDPVGMDPEDRPYLSSMRQRVEQRLWHFEEEVEKRRAGASSAACTVTEAAAQLRSGKLFNRQKTEQALDVALRKFVEFAGDLRVDQVDRPMAVAFIDDLAQRYAHNTLQRDVSFVRQVFGLAVDRGWISLNPFDRINLRGKGRPADRRLTFRRSQLDKLFALRMKAQDRLCMSILAATGMRLDEVALLEWQDIQEEGGVKYFDLQRVNKVVKNQSAARAVPVPNVINLPPRGSGRLFNYRCDADGKAQNAASRALMKHVKQVRDDADDKRLTVHSLRHTYKDLMRNVGVPEEVQNFLMGHTGAGQGSRYGSGPSLATKAHWVEQLDLSFLCASH